VWWWGDELRGVLAAASGMLTRLVDSYGALSGRPWPSNFDKGSREVRIKTDRIKATELGVSVDSLGRGVAAVVEGIRVADFEFRGESIDVVAKRDPAFAMSPEDLLQTPIAVRNADGSMGTVPLASISRIERADAPQEIKRIEERRAVKLTVAPPDTVALEEATADVRAIEAELRNAGAIGGDVAIAYAGSASKLAEVRKAMLGEWTGFNLGSAQTLALSKIFIALLVTYLLMAALFESFLYPLVIMFSVPLATVGGFLGLSFVHDGWGMEAWPLIGESLYGTFGPAGIGLINPAQQLDTLTMLGFVILIGVVVNNAILIVHQALNFMRGLGEGEGDDTGVLAPREAIRASVRSRVRPIFMTTATSVAGMVPLVLMPGSGSELYRGLGSVVVGGLLVSTAFTLIVVPLLFSLALDGKQACYRLMGWSLDEAQAPA